MYNIKLFLFFSFIGYIFETILGTYRGSGILFGPCTPVYGFGVVIVINIYNFINKKKNLHGIKKLIISFLIGFIILSFFEYISGTLIEAILKTVYWDYSNQKFNIGRYTSLTMALIWGLSSVFIVYIIKPISKKITDFIPNYIAYISFTLFFIDLIISILPSLVK